MRRAVLDIETNGLLPELTTIHCLVLRDLDSDTVLSCADQPGYPSIADGLAALQACERVYAHNGVTFDMPAIKKLHPDFQFTGEVFDTLVASRLCFSETLWGKDMPLVRKKVLPRKFQGRHSLEAWGYRLGALKGDYGKQDQAWEYWSPQMQQYCERDTLVTKQLVLRLRKHKVPLKALDIDQRLAKYLDQVETNGFPFDTEKAIALVSELAAEREAIGQRLIEHFGQFPQRNGKPFIPKRDNKKLGYIAGAEVQKLKWTEFNPGSRDHISYCLIHRYGWKPEAYGNDGKPTVDDDTLKGLTYPPIADLVQYLLLSKRLGQISEGKKGWLKLTRKHPVTGLDHIHGRIDPYGTGTFRASHSNPNISQTPKVGKPYGKQCRELWYVPPGWVQLGCDMSGIENRCLAHDMARYDSGAYVEVVTVGDIHATNQAALGLPDEPADGRDVYGRDATKTFWYAYLYGGGDEKLGSILFPTLSKAKQAKKGKEYRARFENALPALGHLVKALKHAAKDRGYLKGIDGRRIYVRSEHSVLNFRLQSTAATLARYWLVRFCEKMEREFGPQGWDGKWALLMWSHDELQTAVWPEIADRAGELCVEAIEELTAYFNFRCPVTGKYVVGANWKDCH